MIIFTRCAAVIGSLLLAGCLSPGSDVRPFEWGRDGEKLYIGEATGLGDSFEEAQVQALLMAASQAVGVEFDHVREFNGRSFYENTRTRIRAVNHRIRVLEHRTLADGQKKVRIWGLFQPLSEVPESQWW